jgi:uncharacterized protein YndB with AHSA1/START domain
MRWFGPHSCPIVECKVDLRVGGAWRYVLRGPDGKSVGVYQEIAPYERLVSTESFDDTGGSLNTAPELVIERMFDAPRELVFACWTDPERLKHWQGAPRGFAVTSIWRTQRRR